MQRAHQLGRQFLAGLRLFLREPQALFWFLGFPVTMLLLLGLVFGQERSSQMRLVWAQEGAFSAPDVALLSDALAEQGLRLDVQEAASAREEWARGKLALLLEGELASPRLLLNSYLLNQGKPQAALVQQAAWVVQARRLGQEAPAAIPISMQSPGGKRAANYVGFLLPGLLGLNLLMMGAFGTTMSDVEMRSKGHYKRMAITPLPRWLFLAAQLGVRLVLLALSALALLGVGQLAFGVHIEGSLAALALLMLIGSLCFGSMGYVLASFVESVDAANGLANLVAMPLMMVSGVYFSMDSAPRWLQAGVDLLPLAPLLQALRAVFNDGASLSQLGTPLSVLAAWTVGLFLLAVKRFRWA